MLNDPLSQTPVPQNTNDEKKEKRVTIASVIALLILLGLIAIFFFFFYNKDKTSQQINEKKTAGTLTSGEVVPQLNLDDLYKKTPDYIPDEDIVSTAPDRSQTSAKPPITLPIPLVFKIFDGPTAGYKIREDTAGITRIDIVEGGSGTRYSTPLFPPAISRVGGGEVTRVKKAHIFDANKVLLIYENQSDELQTNSAFVPFNTLQSQGIELFLKNIKATTNNANKLFYLQKTPDGSIGGVIDATDAKSKTIIWKNAITQWNIQWGNNDLITIKTPLSETLSSFVYRADPNGIKPTKRTHGRVLGTSILYHDEQNTSVQNYILNKKFVTEIKTPEQSTWAIETTLPEKCAGYKAVFICGLPIYLPQITRSGNPFVFPDSWYLGDATFDDIIILFDSTTKQRYELVNPDSTTVQNLTDSARFDIVDPYISKKLTFFFFINNVDLSLWAVRLQ
ncbi:MAG: hypothetical protein QM526_00245 [Alphaproteobacteria bacterium]|nr:hypothetical protein [Alphaproteobacteria bacterium]